MEPLCVHYYRHVPDSLKNCKLYFMRDGARVVAARWLMHTYGEPFTAHEQRITDIRFQQDEHSAEDFNALTKQEQDVVFQHWENYKVSLVHGGQDHIAITIMHV